MTKLNFFKAELRPVDDCELKHIIRGQEIHERISECPECQGTDWWLLPNQSAAVREGGKPYCECVYCGYQTHL